VAGRLYLDASALVKLVVEEPESSALAAAIGGAPEMTSSAVAAVEVPLAARRSKTTAAVQAAEELLGAVALVWLTRDVVRRAGRLTDLRTLDAIHLASALSLESSIEGFVVYDRRLAAAAARAGLEVLTPV
jgi:predicted nucleic acid-binding protein